MTIPAGRMLNLWSSLGECLLEAGQRQEAALRALDNHLAVDQRKPNRARTNLLPGAGRSSL